MTPFRASALVYLIILVILLIFACFFRVQAQSDLVTYVVHLTDDKGNNLAGFTIEFGENGRYIDSGTTNAQGEKPFTRSRNDAEKTFEVWTAGGYHCGECVWAGRAPAGEGIVHIELYLVYGGEPATLVPTAVPPATRPPLPTVTLTPTITRTPPPTPVPSVTPTRPASTFLQLSDAERMLVAQNAWLHLCENPGTLQAFLSTDLGRFVAKLELGVPVTSIFTVTLPDGRVLHVVGCSQNLAFTDGQSFGVCSWYGPWGSWA
jgi:hypothetical protein